MRRPTILILALALALVAAGIIASAGLDRRGPRRRRTIRLKVMTFNIREGGVHGQFSKVVEAITAGGRRHRRAAGAVRAGRGSWRRALGWYAAPRLHTRAHVPILQPAGSHGFWGWLLVAQGKVVDE